MDHAEPVNLVVALVVAGIGVAMFAGLFVWFFVELRKKRKLRERKPDLDVDQDIHTYVDRVFLLIEGWRPRLNPETRAEVDALWEQVLGEIEVLQAARSEGDDASEHVATLIELEAEIEEAIAGGT